MIEELATIITQSLEILKGKAMLQAQKIQKEINDLAKESETPEPQMTHVIGFQLPEEEEYYEEDFDEDD